MRHYFSHFLHPTSKQLVAAQYVSDCVVVCHLHLPYRCLCPALFGEEKKNQTDSF